MTEQQTKKSRYDSDFVRAMIMSKLAHTNFDQWVFQPAIWSIFCRFLDDLELEVSITLKSIFNPKEPILAPSEIVEWESAKELPQRSLQFFENEEEFFKVFRAYAPLYLVNPVCFFLLSVKVGALEVEIQRGIGDLPLLPSMSTLAAAQSFQGKQERLIQDALKRVQNKLYSFMLGFVKSSKEEHSSIMRNLVVATVTARVWGEMTSESILEVFQHAPSGEASFAYPLQESQTNA